MLSLKGKSVLLCEDHALNASITIKVLEHACATVVRANNGRDGLRLFLESEPGEYDIVLMDICMPVMDGLEAARAIRSLPREDAKSVPIVAMTAKFGESDKKESLQAEMNAHLTKPVDPKEMYSVMEKLISQRPPKTA